MTLDSKRAGALSRRRLLLGSGVTAMVAATGLMGSKSFAATTAYKYDELGRLILVTHADGTKTGYAYDAADNRTQAAVNSGVSTPIVIQVTATSNLRTLANNAGYAGGPGANYQFVVGSGVTVTGAAGGKGIDTGIWPSDAVLALIVNGIIYGGGGKGGAGTASGAGAAGSAGGDAVYVQAPISITVNTGATIKSGGGGGGGGGSGYASSGGSSGGGTLGGDGGGGGFPNGLGGAGSAGTAGDQAVAGSVGTTAGGGSGGASGPPGGKGGSAGTAGSAGTTSSGAGGAGGAAGYAVRKNGNTVPVTNNGTITGTAA